MLGAIADDVTGATDIASRFVEAGCRTILTFGVPTQAPPEADAIVVATKSRMLPVAEACQVVTTASDYLQRIGVRQTYFKYCSTFDSTDQGNIGPGIDALMERLGAEFTIACPAYPALRRTMYQGHLFVGDRLLSESSMRHHPLTPMHDPDIVRVLGRQTSSRVGLIPLETVDAGVEETRAAIRELMRDGVRMAVADAIFDRHIATLAAAGQNLLLVTGGAALGGALGAHGDNRRADGIAASCSKGPTAFLSGSCSAMTRLQIAAVIDKVPSLLIDPIALAANPELVGEAIAWSLDRASKGDFLVYSTTDPATVADIQRQLGRDAAATSIESAFARIARELSAAGVRRFVVAGGETSGAVILGLGVEMMAFGEELAPGVPWAHTIIPDGYTLALKSGNFGDRDFFLRARSR